MRPVRHTGFDTTPSVEHPCCVQGWFRRLAAVAMSLVFVTGNAAVCAGWAPSPEARMACCAEAAACPMHTVGSHGARSGRIMTQAQADTCCASSERDHSSQPRTAAVASITSAVLGALIVLPASVPALMLSDGWRTTAPIPSGPTPKHVLLSVFLV